MSGEIGKSQAGHADFIVDGQIFSTVDPTSGEMAEMRKIAAAANAAKDDLNQSLNPLFNALASPDPAVRSRVLQDRTNIVKSLYTILATLAVKTYEMTKDPKTGTRVA